MKKRLNRRHILLVIIAVCVAVSIPVVYFFLQSRFNFIPQLVSSHTSQVDEADFPVIDQTNLSPEQQKVINILREEYRLQPKGTKYSEDVNEPWCADFVSWVFNQAGVPLANPNSGYWRIPGTYTLRDYYEKNKRFEAAESVYIPKVGDIMLYDNPSPFGQHTNIIISVSDGVITTIGGNEPGGIRIVRHLKADGAGFIGYGVF